MPLNDREQEILAEIERHFHAEDRGLVRAVRRIDRQSSRITRLATIGVVAGLILMALSITSSTVLAVIGFVLVVASATQLIQSALHRNRESDEVSEDSDSNSRNKGRRRFRRD